MILVYRNRFLPPSLPRQPCHFERSEKSITQQSFFKIKYHSQAPAPEVV
jgi:hypothetical protein